MDIGKSRGLLKTTFHSLHYFKLIQWLCIIIDVVYRAAVSQSTPLQQGTQQLLVVLHEPKEAAALARAIKQEARPERAAATAPAEFISQYLTLNMLIQ